MAKNPSAVTPPSLIKATPVLLSGAGAGSVSMLEMIPAMGISASMHILIVVGFVLVLLINPSNAGSTHDTETVVSAGDDSDAKTQEADENKESADDPEDPTNIFDGNKPDVPIPVNDSSRIGDVTMPGPTMPNEIPGNQNAMDNAIISTSPPPGAIPFTGDPSNGLAIPVGPGAVGDIGIVGLVGPGSFAARTNGQTREHMLEQFGGNKQSEAAVARGLLWLSKHQSREGNWAMDTFTDHVEYVDGKEVMKRCNCEGGALHANVAGTAFGLLPFLGAGLTPENSKKESIDYSKQIEKGLQWLVRNQGADGRFVERGGKQNDQYAMYEHGLATICICEAASLYPKPWVRQSAQRAVDFLRLAQDPKGGGWRYGPHPTPGDSSVVGWCIMGLQSGRMAGLNVPMSIFDNAMRFFDSAEAEASEGVWYGYTDKSNAQGNRTLTSVGLLCRMYMGWKRENPKLVKGVAWLKRNYLPSEAAPSDMYFNYYATQVMHHMGADAWAEWNPRMRDILIKTQDSGGGNHPHQFGSWSPKNDQWCSIGGRVMMTSLCLLTLEVYYRHLPLYRTEQSTK